MELNTGEFAIHGALTGVKLVSSELSEESTISQLNLSAPGQHLSRNGPISTLPHRQSKTIPRTIRPYILCLNLNTPDKNSLLLKVLAAQRRPNSLTVRESFRIRSLRLLTFLSKSIGETSMAVTTCHGIRTSTFPNTVAPAGLRALLALSLTDSTLWTTLRTQHPSASMLKQSLMLMLVAVAMVVTPPRYTSTLSITVFPTVHACNTLPTICKLLMLTLTCAEIAILHHQLRAKLESRIASQCPTESTT